MYTMRNPEQPSVVFTVPREMCYENKLMVGSRSPTEHTSELIYLNIHEASNSCITNDRRWYHKYVTRGRSLDIILTIMIVGFTVLVEFGYIPHVNLGFYCADPEISHRFTGDTITATVLALVTFMAPMLIIYLVDSNRNEGGVPLQKMWLWYRGYLICLISFLMLCQTLKISTGEHRPHFLHTCAPDATQTCSPGVYVTEYKCMNTEGFKGYIVPDSSLSFPSGHAGIAAITSFFCAVLIHMRLKIRHFGKLIKPTLITLVSIWGFVVGISRVQDRRHHWWDVLAGIILGISFATYSITFHCEDRKSVV